MQFTEVSELNGNIDYLRTGSRLLRINNDGVGDLDYASPFYEDTDRVVSKLLNHSPPVESFYPPKGETDTVNNVNPPIRKETQQNQRTMDKKSQDNRSKTLELQKQAMAREKPSVQFKAYKVEDIPPPKGLLGEALKTADSGHAGHAGPLVGLTIYLPNRKQMKVQIPKTLTVEETIKYVLKKRRAEERPSDTPLHHPRMYELRLHEEDGMPDEDLPALEGNAEIDNFFDEEDCCEFCLCEVAGTSVIPSSEEEDNSKAEEMVSSVQNDHMRRLEHATATSGLPIIKIFLPDHGEYTIVQVPENFKVYQLLAKVQTKQRLPLFKDEYQFKIAEQDRQRLGLLQCVLEMDMDVRSLGVKNLELCRRRYADAPEYLRSIENGRAADAAAIREQQQKRYDEKEVTENATRGGGSHSDRKRDVWRQQDEAVGRKHGSPLFRAASAAARREDPENFLFNELTSAVYEEWNVIKTNKWGKRQKRVMGIDYEKIYNKLRVQHGKGRLSNLAVKRAERRISDVLDIRQVENNPSAFVILYRESKFVEADTTSLEYEAEDGPAAAALIIAKIKYNLNQIRGRKHQ